ncbi:hypothetical protein ADK76_17335 [Streptomyces griseoflavus]|uniref:hypothetical protein n=1 Tax=Streptomyces rimosus TaxID=1927 RepID=UPI0004C502CA|nr:hypothetical protein [Streptomyces rimosus]KOG58330.1 hypothetical protein ADK76_17335 [Streptomyces griseoflavus]
MPSPHLRKAQPIVRRYCQEAGIHYLQASLFASYRQVLKSLHHAGTPIRQETRAVPDTPTG